MTAGRSYIGRFFAVALALALAGAFAGAPGLASAGDGRTQIVHGKPYVIGIPDRVRVSVWQNPELTVEVPVRRDGKVSVPLVGDVQAAGLTPSELQAVLTGALSGFIAEPYVTVIVTETLSNPVTVVGAVKESGRMPLLAETRVLDAIASMGGFTTWAKKDRVRIIRQAGAKPREFVFNYLDYAAGKKLEQNIVLVPGDVVVVPE